jgi:predicted CoA-binding protein
MRELMQETYNDIVDEKNKAVTAYKRYTRDINDNTDIALVGRITNDLLKIIDQTINQKIKLIKIQSDILYKNAKIGNTEEENFVITEDDKKWAESFLKNQNGDFNEKEYD